MTEQTKRFIELGDIVSLQMTCKNCSATICVPVSQLNTLPVNCFNCKAVWAEAHTGELQRDVEGLIGHMNALQHMSKLRHFLLSLELSPIAPSSSGRASSDKD